MTIEKRKSSGPSRRTVIKGMGAAVAASTIAMPWVARAAGTIKVGVVSPASGPLALFGDADGWTIRSADHSITAHAEHTVALTPNGTIVLTARD